VAASNFEKYDDIIPSDLKMILSEIKAGNPIDIANDLHTDFIKVFSDMEKEFRNLMSI
jgi:hypothetical protein